MTPPTAPFTTASRAEGSSNATTTSLHDTQSGKVTGVRRAAIRAASWAERTWRAVSLAGAWTVRTVTSVGWFVMGAAVVGLGVGLLLNWTEMLVIGVASLILVGIAALFLLGGRSYEVTISLDEDRITAGSGMTAQLVVANHQRGLILPARLEVPVGAGLVELPVPMLAPRGAYRQRIQLSALRRGIVDVGPVRAVRSDPIGLVRRTIEYTQVKRLWVHPETVLLPNISIGSIRDLDGVPSSTIVTSDVSFHAIREYQPGDPQRNVHWKSTAKTGKLMVRQYEESRRASQTIILSRCEADYASADEFELAVSAATSLGLQGIRFGRDTTVSVSPQIPEFQTAPARTLVALPATSRLGLLDASCGLEMNPRAAGLLPAAELVGLFVEHMSVAFLVAGSRSNIHTLQTAALRLPFGVRVVVILCDPLLPPRMNVIDGLEIYGIAVVGDLMQLARRQAV